MASDIDHAEFLKSKFYDSFGDLKKAHLPPEVNRLLESINLQLRTKKFRSPESISLLYDLNDGIAEYQLITGPNQDVKKTFTNFLPISQSKFSNLEYHLSNINKKIKVHKDFFLSYFDLAESLKKKFFTSYQDLKNSYLSPEIKRLLESINEELNHMKVQSDEPISWLYDLNDAVAYCQFFTQQNQDVKKTFYHCLSISQSKFSWDLKSQLSSIKDKIKDHNRSHKDSAASSPPPQPPPTIIGNIHVYKYEGQDPSFKIHGFEEQEKDIVNLLLAPEKSAALKAIGIYGMCGTGKTTLVKKVLENAKVRDEFSSIIWMSMSDICSKDDLDITIVKNILSTVFGLDIDRLTGDHNDVWFVQELHRYLSESKGYLIVVDDLWYYNEWFRIAGDLNVETEEEKRNVNRFCCALPRDGVSGAVIVTSRLKEVAMKMVGDLYHLKPLDSEENESAKNCLKAIVMESLKPDDEELINEIVRRCYGLPLAARILGDKVRVALEEEEEHKKEGGKKEEQRKKEEEGKKEELSKKEEESKKEELRKEEEERKNEELRRKGEEGGKKEEMRKEEEERKNEELRRKEEEGRKKEELRKKEEEERKNEELRRKEEEEGKKEELRKKEEEGKKEELRKKEEESKKEELRKEEEERKNEELRRKEEEGGKKEELRKKEEEKRKNEELRRKEEEEGKKEELRKMEEQEREKKELRRKEEEELRRREEEEEERKKEEMLKKKEEESRKKEEEEELQKEQLRKKEEEEGKKE